jgi:hypothetical protein
LVEPLTIAPEETSIEIVPVRRPSVRKNCDTSWKPVSSEADCGVMSTELPGLRSIDPLIVIFGASSEHRNRTIAVIASSVTLTIV